MIKWVSNIYRPRSEASEGCFHRHLSVQRWGGGQVGLFPEYIIGHMIILGRGFCPPGKAETPPPPSPSRQEGRPPGKADPLPRRAELLPPPLPGRQRTSQYGQCAGGTHPTRMHTYFSNGSHLEDQCPLREFQYLKSRTKMTRAQNVKYRKRLTSFSYFIRHINLTAACTVRGNVVTNKPATY